MKSSVPFAAAASDVVVVIVVLRVFFPFNLNSSYACVRTLIHSKFQLDRVVYRKSLLYSTRDLCYTQTKFQMYQHLQFHTGSILNSHAGFYFPAILISLFWIQIERWIVSCVFWSKAFEVGNNRWKIESRQCSWAKCLPSERRHTDFLKKIFFFSPFSPWHFSNYIF